MRKNSSYTALLRPTRLSISEKSATYKIKWSYTVYRYITHSKKFAGKQGRHEIFAPSILPYIFGLIFIRMKQFFFFFEVKKKNSKWPIFQNGRFSKLPIRKIFLWKFHRLVLGLVRLIDQYSSTYMVVRMFDIRAKTGKKCIFCVFKLFLLLYQTPSRPYRFGYIIAIHINQFY